MTAPGLPGPHLREQRFEPYTWRWDEGTAMLYALGVGAGPARDLRFVYEGADLAVLPSFATVPVGTQALTLFATLGLDPYGVLHGGQSVALHRPLPVAGEATMTRAVTDVWDKGSGAVVVVEDRAVAHGEPLFDLRSTWFVLGGGGFGGERGPSVRGRLAGATGAPDRVLRHRVRDDQAALYRLSGDRHPIHIDPEAARVAGFEAPFLHGLCTLGIVTLEVVAELCGGEPERVRALDSRFTSPVEFGDELAVSAWTGATDAIAVRAAAGDRTVLEARFTLAAWD